MSQILICFFLVSTHPIAHAIEFIVTFKFKIGDKSPMKFGQNDAGWSRNIIRTLHRLALHNKVRQDNVWTGVIFGWNTFTCVMVMMVIMMRMIMMRIRMK